MVEWTFRPTSDAVCALLFRPPQVTLVMRDKVLLKGRIVQVGRAGERRGGRWDQGM